MRLPLPSTRTVFYTRTFTSPSSISSFSSTATEKHIMADQNVRKIQQAFLANPRFAVVGASKDQAKYGTRVLKWYQARNLDITPVHPKEKELEGVAAITTISELPFPSETGISIVTPPKVTLAILKLGKELNVPHYWIQIGAEDEAVLEYVKENLADRTIVGGPCILVEGDSARAATASL